MKDGEFLLRVLADGRPHSLNEILRRSFAERGCGLTVHSRAADLRRDGHNIANWKDGIRGDGSWYRLLLESARWAVSRRRLERPASWFCCLPPRRWCRGGRSVVFACRDERRVLMTRYRTIVADPPWHTTAGPAGGGMGEGFVGGDGKSRPLAYSTMTVSEVADLPVRSLAAKDCALYLWTTNGHLRDAFYVLRAWGFTYSTTIVWAKNLMGGGLGGAWGISTEFVLYARWGHPTERGRIPGTWFNWKRPYDERGKPKHSAKPLQLQDAVETLHDGPRLEMFARRNRLGWDTWGNEALQHVELSA